MQPKPTSIENIFLESEKQNLYQQLVLQLKKDFLSANQPIELAIEFSAQMVKNALAEKLMFLLHHNFDNYLHLLYIIDVSEDEIKKIDGNNMEKYTENVVFLILQREWKKVWFKKFYSK